MPCFLNADMMLLFTHMCPVTEFAVASHLNTANSCCHHVFLRHFRFQKCLSVNSYGKMPLAFILSQNHLSRPPSISKNSKSQLLILFIIYHNYKKAAAKPTSLNIDSAGSQQLLFNSYLQSRDTPCRSCPLHVQPRIPLPNRIRTDAQLSDHPGIRRSSGFLPVPDSL